MIQIHDKPHPLAGTTVKVKDSGEEFRIEDWADRVYGGSIWKENGNPAAMAYAINAAMKNLPIDNEILYGKVNGLGALLHVSEIQQ